MSDTAEQKQQENIAILYGGKSGEHEVSLRSAFSVYNHLPRESYRPLLIGITLEGIWYLQPEIPASRNEALMIRENAENRVFAAPGEGLFCGGRKLDIDLVFPVLHGSFGEDGTVQGLLELCELPYAGAGVLGSSLSMDKSMAKDIWSAAGLPVVPYIRVDTEEFRPDGRLLQEKLAYIQEKLSLPLFVKPLRAGSSVGVSRVDLWENLEQALTTALRYDTAAMVEPAINGKEVECSVIGNFQTETFPPGEILPTHEFYDYEAKYIDPDGALLQLPADIPQATADTIRRIAAAAYRAAGVEGMARVDFFVEKESGEVMLNEINTIPGFTSISMFPRMCEAGGLIYPALIARMIELGKIRHQRRSACVYSLLLKTGAEG